MRSFTDFIYLEPGAIKDAIGNWKSFKYRTGTLDEKDGGRWERGDRGSYCIKSIPIHRADLPKVIYG